MGEAAKFMWMHGMAMMLHGKWEDAAEILDRAAAKKDGWGWGVNNGEIWMSAAAAKMMLVTKMHNAGAEQSRQSDTDVMEEILECLKLARGRCAQHPWLKYNTEALTEYMKLLETGGSI